MNGNASGQLYGRGRGRAVLPSDDQGGSEGTEGGKKRRRRKGSLFKKLF